jgi:hypothetical protein
MIMGGINLTLAQYLITLLEHRIRYRAGDEEIHSMVKRDAAFNLYSMVLRRLASQNTATFIRHMDHIVNEMMTPLPCVAIEVCENKCKAFVGRSWIRCPICQVRRPRDPKIVYCWSIQDKLIR